MQPRLGSSKKWTPLPKELMQQVRAVFNETFAEHLGKGKIETEGRIYPGEILISVGFREKGVLKQSNFEVSIAYKKDKDNVLKLLHLAVDAAGSLLDKVFTSEDDSEFPRIWTEVDFEGRQIYVQYTTVNSELESAADSILGIGDSAVIAQGEWDDEITPEQVKAALGIDPEDLEEVLEEDEVEPPPPTTKRAPKSKKPTNH